jgi:hypothetical protein
VPEETVLHDLPLTGVELLQSVIQREYLIRIDRGCRVRLVKGVGRDSGATLRRPALAHVVDKNLPHGAGGDGEEVRTVLRLQRTTARQLDVGFMDQRGRLDRAVPPLAAELALCPAPQIVVDDRDDPVECLAVARP